MGIAAVSMAKIHEVTPREGQEHHHCTMCVLYRIMGMQDPEATTLAEVVEASDMCKQESTYHQVVDIAPMLDNVPISFVGSCMNRP